MRAIYADTLKDCFPCPAEKYEMKGQQTLWDAREIRETIDLMPTVDAVPRQKYEEDMENAYAHGYTDAESNFRKMIADGELVEVIRCKDCRWNNGENYCLNDGTFFELCADDAYCSFGERKTDEEIIRQYHERHKEVLKERSMPVGRNVIDALRERRTDE